VNIAVRLESQAPPGGILVSRTVHEAVAGRLKATFDDLGSLELKNIDRPIQAFRVAWEAADWTVSGRTATVMPSDGPPPLPDKPSIAVLPFQNMSGDSEQEYFVDGLVEEIITGLSRSKALFVIARNSSFTYKGRAVDVRQVGRELGVRYVLEGSVRKAGNRLRIIGQLVEAANGVHLWADRFDGDLADIFELQDQITAQVIGAIAPRLELAEIERAVAGYRVALQTTGDMEALRTNLLNQEKTMQVMFEAGEISKADLAALRLQLGASALARLDALTKSQQALGLLEDALQSSFGVAASVWQTPPRLTDTSKATPHP
jgi:TolB-like protein